MKDADDKVMSDFLFEGIMAVIKMNYARNFSVSGPVWGSSCFFKILFIYF